ncbi:uncharacterized protein TNCV_2562901 [Trichonephila clavipes]|uniref:Uncharacterized protein n=1 Tax=Trichonephila clavipes TaxID=2585209 RepID=A0A8X6UNU9_TRICX|nr:uncharacterized protein TNCV_2562901 [Trichonephila clavipes]
MKRNIWLPTRRLRQMRNQGCHLATRGLLVTDHVILNHGQVTWTTPELVPPLLTSAPHQREDASALDRFNVHRCPIRRVFNGTGLEFITRPATIRYLDHSATATTKATREDTPLEDIIHTTVPKSYSSLPFHLLSSPSAAVRRILRYYCNRIEDIE